MSSDNRQSFPGKGGNGDLYEKVQELGEERMQELENSLNFVQNLRRQWLAGQNPENKENTVGPNDQDQRDSTVDFRLK